MSLSYKSDQVIGGPVTSGSLTQLGIRKQKISKKSDRTDQDLLFLNSTTGWVRLYSSVDIDTPPPDSKETASTPAKADSAPPKPEYSSEQAKNYVLTGGILKDEKLRGGLFNESGPDGYDLSPTLGYRPMPGIVSFSVKSKNNFGTLRDATVQIKVNSVEQLDIIEKLYFRPGMTALLEWGHSIYYNNEGIFSADVKQYGSEFFNASNQQAIMSRIKELRENSSYNYDAVYGFVKNFAWTYNLDGGYDCKVDIISPGELVESLQLVLSPTATNSGASVANTDEAEKLETELGDATNLHKFMKGFLVEFKKGETAPISNSLSVSLGGMFSTFASNLAAVGRNWNKDGNILYIRFNGKGITYNTVTAQKNSGRFIRMSTFLEIVNRCFTLKDKNSNIIQFNYGQSKKKTPFFTFFNHVALDPATAIIPKKPDSGQLAWFFQELVPEESNDILDIYLNVKYILNCYTEATKGDKKDRTVLNFIKKILDGLTLTFGDVNDFDIHYEEEEFTYYIVDRRVVPGKVNLSSSKIDLVGLNSQLENLSISATLSNTISTMLAISAQANSSDIGTDVLMLQQWNKGLRDRHIQTKNIDIKSDKEGDEKTEKDGSRIIGYIKTVNAKDDSFSYGRYAKFNYDPQDIEGLIPSHKSLMNDLSEYYTKLKKENPGGIIPFKLSFTMRGISGLKIGQAFLLEDYSFLPEKYRDNVAFLITGVDHKIASNRWTVDITSQMILTDVFTGTLAERNVIFSGELFSKPLTFDIDTKTGKRIDKETGKPIDTPNADELRKAITAAGYTEKGNALSNYGDLSPAGLALGKKLIEVSSGLWGGIQFTSGNDIYHYEKAPNSKHTRGDVLDITIPGGAGVAKLFVDFLGEKGIAADDEYNKPSGHSSGPHIHVKGML